MRDDYLASCYFIFYCSGQCRDGDGLDQSSCDVNQYLNPGFSLLQLAIDTVLIRVGLDTVNKLIFVASSLQGRILTALVKDICLV